MTAPVFAQMFAPSLPTDAERDLKSLAGRLPACHNRQ